MPPLSIQHKLWLRAVIITAGLLAILLIYTYWYNSEFSLLSISQAVAGTAGFLIGASFALGPLAHYFKKLSPKVALRKYIGLMGFWLALTYSVLLILVDPNRYWHNLPANLGTADVLLGVLAVAILSVMALVSNRWGIKTLGPKTWKQTLRLGYVAYALLIARGIVLEWQLWSDWFSSLDGVPPPRLVLSVFALAVITLRITVLLKKPHKNEAYNA